MFFRELDLRCAAALCACTALVGCVCRSPGTDGARDAGRTDGTSSCGDGYIDEGETCDVIVPAETTCASLGFGAGNVRCTPACALDVSGCCGDGTAGGDEPCEGVDLRGWTCAALGYVAGGPSCALDCTLDVSGCTFPNEGALWFDGADDVVDCQALPWLLAGSATWEAWIFVTPGSSMAVPLSRLDPPPEDPLQGGGSFRGFGIGVEFPLGTDGEFHCKFYHNGGELSFTGELEATAGAWHHVACVIEMAEAPSGSGLAPWIKAMLDDDPFVEPFGFTGKGAPVEGVDAGATGDLYFGARPDAASITGSWGVFSGYLDEVRVWSYARSEEEIRRDLFRELRGDEFGLVAYYTFDEEGPEAADSSPSASACILGTSPGADSADPAWSPMTPFP